MADLKQVNVPPPFNGLDTASAPGKCPVGRGPLVRNFLVHVPGRLPIRGPLSAVPFPPAAVSTALGTSNNIMTGAWKFNDKLLLGFMEKSSAVSIPPWVAPYWRLTVGTNLAKSSKSLIFVNLTEGTATKITSAVQTTAPSGESARLEKYAYGFAFYNTETDITTANAMAKTKLLRWDGTATEPTIYTNAPSGGQFVKAYLNRLFVLGGSDPTFNDYVFVQKKATWSTAAPILNVFGMTENETFKTFHKNDLIKNNEYFAEGTTISSVFYTGGLAEIVLNKNPIKNGVELIGIVGVKLVAGAPLEPNTLIYSEGGGPYEDRIELWKSPVSGLLNKIVVGDEDGNDYGVALAVVGQTMIIFKRHSIWGLYGYGSSTFQIKNLTTERGCIDPNSVCEVDGGVYFASQNGIEFWNGSEFVQVDTPINNIVGSLASFHAGERGVHVNVTCFSRINISYIGNDYILLSFSGQVPNTGGIGGTNFSAYMNVNTGNWSQFTTDAFESTGVPQFTGTTTLTPWAFDGNKILPMPFLTDPEGAKAAALTSIDNINASAKAIPAKYWTDRIALSSPGYVSQIHRFMFDYAFPNGASDAAAQPGWFIKMIKEDGSDLLPEQQVPGHGLTSPLAPMFGLGSTKYPFGRRFLVDDFQEAIDCQLQVEWKTNTFEVGLAECGDATIELSTARQRRSV